MSIFAIAHIVAIEVWRRGGRVEVPNTQVTSLARYVIALKQGSSPDSVTFALKLRNREITIKSTYKSPQIYRAELVLKYLIQTANGKELTLNKVDAERAGTIDLRIMLTDSCNIATIVPHPDSLPGENCGTITNILH